MHISEHHLLKLNLLFLISSLPVFLSAQIPDFNRDSLAMKHVKSVTEWTYAMEKNGKKYEAMKMLTNEYDRLGRIQRHTDHDGAHSPGEEKELFSYTNFGKLNTYAHYVDTALILTIAYQYDSLNQLKTEVVRDADCKDSSRNYTILHHYTRTWDNAHRSFTDTAWCSTCFEARKVTDYDSRMNPVSENKYDRNGRLLSEITCRYKEDRKLKEKYTKWNYKCSRCINDRAVYVYNPGGMLIRETHFRDTREVEKDCFYEYDGRGLLARARRTYFQNPRILVSEYRYVFYD